MKIGVLTVLFSGMKVAKALDYIVQSGCEAVELGCGGFPGKAHADPEALLADNGVLGQLQHEIKSRGLIVSALSCHGNPVHPNEETAAAYRRDFDNTVRLAESMGVDTVITFSGCPGDGPGARYPNWVTCPWPEDLLHVLDYQWNEVLIPYWQKTCEFASGHGVRVALEMHPNFCVYNPETMLKLRKAVGPVIGANFDPSHLWWQGIDPVAAIRALGEVIFHFHAKDVKVDPFNTAVNGVLDTKKYADEIHRSWIFRSIGYGHDYQTWKDIVSNLAMIGYDGALSIEHEDSLMSANEGFQKAVSFLKQVVRTETPGAMWWA